MSQQQIVQAYRHLLRHSLRAIQFSKPARYTVRDRLRLAFRKGDASAFDVSRIDNTLEFLSYATRENGLEHRILKNILLVWWDQASGGHKRTTKDLANSELETRTTAYDTFDHNIKMLNESMEICIPTVTIWNPS
jgi:hypothetical protein